MPDDIAPPADPSPAPIDPAPSSIEPGGDGPPSILGEGMAFREGWFNDFTEDAEISPYLSSLPKYKTLGGLIKTAEESRKQLSQRQEGMVKIPGAEATPEEIAAYRTAIGVPESPDAYEISPPEQLPDGIEFQPEQLDNFKRFAHENGISNEVANKLIEFQVQEESAAIASIQEQQAEQRAEQEQALQSEWGNQWQQKKALAGRAAATFGMKPDHPAMQNADVLKLLANVASAISEDKLVSGESIGGIISSEAQATDIIKNPDNPLYGPYWNRDGKYTSSEQQRAIDAVKNFRNQASRQGG